MRGQVAWYIGSAAAELEGAGLGVNPGFALRAPGLARNAAGRPGM